MNQIPAEYLTHLIAFFRITSVAGILALAISVAATFDLHNVRFDERSRFIPKTWTVSHTSMAVSIAIWVALVMVAGSLLDHVY